MDAIAAQKKAVVLGHRLTAVVQPDLGFDAQRASKGYFDRPAPRPGRT